MVNQQLAPDDFTDAGAAREQLSGLHTISGGVLVVELNDNANGRLNADAIRIERQVMAAGSSSLVLSAVPSSYHRLQTTSAVLDSNSGSDWKNLTDGETDSASHDRFPWQRVARRSEIRWESTDRAFFEWSSAPLGESLLELLAAEAWEPLLHASS